MNDIKCYYTGRFFILARGQEGVEMFLLDNPSFRRQNIVPVEDQSRRPALTGTKVALNNMTAHVNKKWIKI